MSAADADQTVEVVELDEHLVERVPAVDECEVDGDAGANELGEHQFGPFLPEIDEVAVTAVVDVLQAEAAPLRPLERIDNDVLGEGREGGDGLTYI